MEERKGNVRHIINLMDLRSTYRWGGGPDKTILNSAKQHDPAIVKTTVVYLCSDWDTDFSLGAKAREMGLNIVEIIEHGAFDRKAFLEVVRIVREQKIDIIHSRDYKTNLYALLIRYFFQKSVKIVTLAHGWVGSGFKLQFYYTIDKVLASFFDRNLLLYKAQRDMFIRKPNRDKTTIVFNGIDPLDWSRRNISTDTLRQELNIPSEQKIIGFVGRIMPEKDIISMLAVADELINKRKIDCVFVLIGECRDTAYQKTLDKSISQTNLESRFLRIGTRTDLKQVYCSFDIFLMTSLQEGFPNSLLEAMALEVPSVVSAVGGIPEISVNKKSGYICQPKDIQGFANAIHAMLDNPEQTKKMVDFARKMVETKLSFENRLRRMESIYTEMMR